MSLQIHNAAKWTLDSRSAYGSISDGKDLDDSPHYFGVVVLVIEADDKGNMKMPSADAYSTLRVTNWNAVKGSEAAQELYDKLKQVLHSTGGHHLDGR